MRKQVAEWKTRAAKRAELGSEHAAHHKHAVISNKRTTFSIRRRFYLKDSHSFASTLPPTTTGQTKTLLVSIHKSGSNRANRSRRQPMHMAKQSHTIRNGMGWRSVSLHPSRTAGRSPPMEHIVLITARDDRVPPALLAVTDSPSGKRPFPVRRSDEQLISGRGFRR
jgi:hypothetical protein